MARSEDARIVIAHVEEDIVGKGGGQIHATEDEIQAEIDRQAKELTENGIETTVEKTSVMLGGPAPAIARIADEADADVIVVGSRGLSAIGGVLMGSVTQRLLHFADVPVLAVPTADRAGADAAAAATGSRVSA
jgi:nucleotide-binding universal stress UspA family protein